MAAANETENSHKARLDSIARRPEEFDARVMNYWPGLKKAAAKFHPKDREKAIDLVTDTIEYSLRNWESYREGGGFWLWLFWNMRGQYSNGKKRDGCRIQFSPVTSPNDNPDGMKNKSVSHEDGIEGKLDRISGGSPASQDAQVELSQVLDYLNKETFGADLIRIAMGDNFGDIADNAIGQGGKVGLTKQAIQQRVSVTRQRLIKAMS